MAGIAIVTFASPGSHAAPVLAAQAAAQPGRPAAPGSVGHARGWREGHQRRGPDPRAVLRAARRQHPHADALTAYRGPLAGRGGHGGLHPRERILPRAARVTDRWDLSGKAIPAGTNSWVGRDARRLACTRTYQISQERYDQLEDQLDDLAAEFAASPAYQQASSADARKKAAARFLIPRADGSSPPTSLILNELHARAQKLAKAARASASGLC